MVGIKYIDYYEPPNVIEIERYLEDVCLINNVESKSIANLTGIKRIRETSTSVLSMLEILLERYVSYCAEREKVRYIFFTDIDNFVEGSYYIPFKLQKEYEFSNASIILSHQQCISTMWAIKVACSLLMKDEIALILSSSKIHGNRYIGYTILGDGAALLELRNSDDVKFKIIDSQDISCAAIDNDNKILQRKNIVVNGTNFINNFLKKHNLNIELDLKTIIPQNVNKHVYENLYSKLLGCKKSKFYLENIPQTGHMGDVDTIYNLKKYSDIAEAGKILLYGLGSFGDNYSYATVLLQLM